MLEVGALVEVLQQEFVAVFEVAFLHTDNRLSEIGELAEELMFDFSKVPIADHIAIVSSVIIVDEELMVVTEVFIEIGIDEGDVIVNAANFEQFLVA